MQGCTCCVRVHTQGRVGGDLCACNTLARVGLRVNCERVHLVLVEQLFDRRVSKRLLSGQESPPHLAGEKEELGQD